MKQEERRGRKEHENIHAVASGEKASDKKAKKSFHHNR
jgi:hypothetical protein